MMGFGNGFDYGFGGVLLVIGCILLVVGLVALVVWAVSRATAHDHKAQTQQSPEALEILRARFARGEINETEYTQATNVLKAVR